MKLLFFEESTSPLGYAYRCIFRKNGVLAPVIRVLRAFSSGLNSKEAGLKFCNENARCPLYLISGSPTAELSIFSAFCVSSGW